MFENESFASFAFLKITIILFALNTGQVGVMKSIPA